MLDLTDKQIRDAGILYLSPQKYLKNPFKLPTDDEEEVENNRGGITLTNVGQTCAGGGGGAASPFNLKPTFLNERRPAPKANFNINPAAFLTGKGRLDPMGSDMDYFLNLPGSQRFGFGFRDSNIPGSANYKPPSKFFQEPSFIDRGIGIFKNLFKPKRFRGELGDRLFKQATGTMAGLPTISNIIGRFRNPLNPNATNYNPDLVGQLNYLEGQDGLIGRSSVGLKYGPESVLFGKNVISGFGTNDYEKALNKYIESAKLKLRKTKNEDVKKRIQTRIDKGEKELKTYLDKSGVGKEREDKKIDFSKIDYGDSDRGEFDTSPSPKKTSTGGGGFADADFGPAEGEFAGLKKGGLAGILYG